jgi:hypothetical protein
VLIDTSSSKQQPATSNQPAADQQTSQTIKQANKQSIRTQHPTTQHTTADLLQASSFSIESSCEQGKLQSTKRDLSNSMGAAKSKTVQVTLPSGNTYSGQMKGTRREGKGVYRWTDGAVYDGDWHNNQQHGHGTQTYPNGNMYTGQFYRNNPNGQGRLVTFNGETIEGKWTFLVSFTLFTCDNTLTQREGH